MKVVIKTSSFDVLVRDLREGYRNGRNRNVFDYSSKGNIKFGGETNKKVYDIKSNEEELFKFIKNESGKLLFGSLWFRDIQDNIHFDEVYESSIYLKNKIAYISKGNNEEILTENHLHNLINTYNNVFSKEYGEYAAESICRFASESFAERNVDVYRFLLERFDGFIRFPNDRYTERHFLNILSMSLLVNPYIFENLIKSGFEGIITDCISGEKLILNLCNGNKTSDILLLPKFAINFLQQRRFVKFDIVERLKNLNKIIGSDGLKLMLDFIVKMNAVFREDIDTFITYLELVYQYYPKYVPASLRDYIIRVYASYYKEDKSLQSIMITLTDYLKMCSDLKLDFDKFPSDLKEAHDKLVVKYKVFKQEYKNTEFVQKIEDCKYLLNRIPEDENYTILVPKDIADITQEGETMRHCVGSYVDNVISGRSKIFFIRKKTNTQKPFVTVELNERDTLVQAKAKGNADPSIEVSNFINKWLKEIKVSNKKEEMLSVSNL